MEFNSKSLKSNQSYITNRLWKRNDFKAQKNGNHNTIYWVKQQNKFEDGTYKGEKWRTSSTYTGCWKNNLKHGFGVQIFSNGEKYEGLWSSNKKNGQGTLWIPEKNNKKKLKRKYTGDWKNDKKEGRGTMFYESEDRYDGFWKNGKPTGEGRMIYKNGDVYIGQWLNGKRSGYGILTKRNGDHFEGQWIEDKREGQGSYYFAKKGKIMIGQWADDNPQTTIYSHLENEKIIDEKSPNLPELDLENAEEILQNALNNVAKKRLFFRARYMAIHILFSPDEIMNILDEFRWISQNQENIKLESVNLILNNLEIYISEEDLKKIILKLFDEEKIIFNFEEISRLIAIYFELKEEFDENDINSYKIEKSISIINDLNN